MTARLHTRIFVDGLRTLVQGRGGFSAVLKQGHPEAGVIALIIRTGSRCADIFVESRDMQGHLEWRKAASSVDDRAVSEWLDREAEFDPDFWALEVEQISPELVLSQHREGT